MPKLLAKSEKGREAYQASWNKYVSPGFILAAEEKPEVINKYFGLAGISQAPGLGITQKSNLRPV